MNEIKFYMIKVWFNYYVIIYVKKKLIILIVNVWFFVWIAILKEIGLFFTYM